MQNHEAFHIVLIEPEIPPNTGNIGRLCAASGAHLHLVGKLGFSLDDKHMKRAGLDYWPEVKLHRWESLQQLKEEYPQGGVDYTAGDFFVFGKETLGLPEELLAAEKDHAILIPILSPAVRSLNLANSAAIILYEALRQTGQLEI